MKFCNNPTRKLERRMGALKRYPPAAPPMPPTSHIVGADREARVAAEVAVHVKLVERWRNERDQLALLVHKFPHNEARRIRTKKDRTSRAKLRFGEQQ